MTAHSIINETVSSGTENHSFGVTDDKGREVGAYVYFTVQTRVAASQNDAQAEKVAPGTYLTAFARSTRDGKAFGSPVGSFARFRIVGENEASAMAQRDAWVKNYLAGAKDRALKNFGK